MAFTEIQTKSLKTLFMERITTMIISEELKIGEKLPPERDIAQQMNISRSVVNDGLNELAKMGFLKIIPRQGTFVADFKSQPTIDIMVTLMEIGNVSNDYIRSTLELRNMFMRYALEKATPVLSKGDIKILEDICTKFNYCKDIKKASQIAYKFDLQLMEFSGNILIPMFFKSFEKPNIYLLEKYIRLLGIENYNQRNITLLEYIAQKKVKEAIDFMESSIQKAISREKDIYNQEK